MIVDLWKVESGYRRCRRDWRRPKLSRIGPGFVRLIALGCNWCYGNWRTDDECLARPFIDADMDRDCVNRKCCCIDSKDGSAALCTFLNVHYKIGWTKSSVMETRSKWMSFKKTRTTTLISTWRSRVKTNSRQNLEGGRTKHDPVSTNIQRCGQFVSKSRRLLNWCFWVFNGSSFFDGFGFDTIELR